MRDVFKVGNVIGCESGMRTVLLQDLTDIRNASERGQGKTKINGLGAFFCRFTALESSHNLHKQNDKTHTLCNLQECSWYKHVCCVLHHVAASMKAISNSRYEAVRPGCMGRRGFQTAEGIVVDAG